jgi:hypothetical protein
MKPDLLPIAVSEPGDCAFTRAVDAERAGEWTSLAEQRMAGDDGRAALR